VNRLYDRLVRRLVRRLRLRAPRVGPSARAIVASSASQLARDAPARRTRARTRDARSLGVAVVVDARARRRATG